MCVIQSCRHRLNAMKEEKSNLPRTIHNRNSHSCGATSTKAGHLTASADLRLNPFPKSLKHFAGAPPIWAWRWVSHRKRLCRTSVGRRIDLTWGVIRIEVCLRNESPVHVSGDKHRWGPHSTPSRCFFRQAASPYARSLVSARRRSATQDALLKCLFRVSANTARLRQPRAK